MSVQVKAVVYWAQLDTVNDLSGKYQVDLCHLSDRAVAALEEEGVDVKFKDDRQSYITCKSTHPIRAVDADGASLEGINIGNESQAVATIGFYAWDFKGKKGVSPSLNRFVITDLVTYEADDNDEPFNPEDAL